MRRNSRYNYYNLTSFLLEQYPLKINSFKRPKWHPLQKRIKATIKKNQIIFLNNYSKNKLNFKSCDRLKRYYKTGQIYKKLFFCLYDNSFNYNIVKKYIDLKKSRLLFLCSFLINTVCRVDLLLWKLNFCKSVFESRQFIDTKKIFVNNILTFKHSKQLHKGDILEIKNFKLLNKFSLKSNLLRFSKNLFLLSFLEVDYYTGTIVMIKDLESFSFEDLQLLGFNFVDIKKYSYIN